MATGKSPSVLGIEINPSLIGVLFADTVGDTLRLFCFYTNAETSQFDVPLEENRENLRALFATLKIDATCTSLIVEDVVQGRIYVHRDGRHWLYTVLKSPGNTIGALDANIADQDWKVIWRTQEVEVLQCGHSGFAEHSLAIRTQISENDAARTMQNSKAFTKPVSIPRSKPQSRLPATVAAILLLVTILGGAAVYYASNKSSRAPVKPETVATAVAAGNAGQNYYVLYNHQITGPYPAKVLTELNAAGVLSAQAMCRTENSTDWIKLSDLASTSTPK